MVPCVQVLVDCEGIDAFDQTLDYSTQVFSLGVLLSSLLIFNQVGSGGPAPHTVSRGSTCHMALLMRTRMHSAAWQH